VVMQDREHLNKLKALVNSQPQWDQFNNYLKELINQQQRIMEQTDNITVLYRAQGALYQLRRLLMLRDEVLKNG